MEKVVSGLKERIDSQGIRVVLRDNLPRVLCDAERIQQVFDNLIGNAIKFSAHREDPEIEIGCRDEGDYYTFYVRDNGIGIRREDQEKIFEAFQRLQEIEDDDGTGLGLAIVERIVVNHGGKIWVESEKGKGATFFFTLPKKES